MATAPTEQALRAAHRKERGHHRDTDKQANRPRSHQRSARNPCIVSAWSVRKRSGPTWKYRAGSDGKPLQTSGKTVLWQSVPRTGHEPQCRCWWHFAGTSPRYRQSCLPCQQVARQRQLQLTPAWLNSESHQPQLRVDSLRVQHQWTLVFRRTAQHQSHLCHSRCPTSDNVHVWPQGLCRYDQIPRSPPSWQVDACSHVQGILHQRAIKICLASRPTGFCHAQHPNAAASKFPNLCWSRYELGNGLLLCL